MSLSECKLKSINCKSWNFYRKREREREREDRVKKLSHLIEFFLCLNKNQCSKKRNIKLKQNWKFITLIHFLYYRADCSDDCSHLMDFRMLFSSMELLKWKSIWELAEQYNKLSAITYMIDGLVWAVGDVLCLVGNVLWPGPLPVGELL
jgi:hypothetical protein